jgi:hypothetical protein
MGTSSSIYASCYAYFFRNTTRAQNKGWVYNGMAIKRYFLDPKRHFNILKARAITHTHTHTQNKRLALHHAVSKRNQLHENLMILQDSCLILLVFREKERSFYKSHSYWVRTLSHMPSSETLLPKRTLPRDYYYGLSVNITNSINMRL